ncbi:hypothetical protein ACWGIU_03600 [Streptomyces sp. NPDC054840]
MKLRTCVRAACCTWRKRWRIASTPVTTSIRSLMLFPVIAARCSSAKVTQCVLGHAQPVPALADERAERHGRRRRGELLVRRPGRQSPLDEAGQCLVDVGPGQPQRTRLHVLGSTATRGG